MPISLSENLVKTTKKIRSGYINLFDSMISVLSALVFYKSTDVKKISSKENLIILGNGPSLNKDFDNLVKVNRNKFDILGVNSFSRTDYYDKIKPDYYFLLDNYYWKKDLAEDHIQDRDAIIKNIIEKTDWKMVILAPTEVRNSAFCNSLMTNKNITFSFFNRLPINGFESLRSFLVGKKLGIFSGQNVILGALSVSLNLDYKKIYLLGVDHSLHMTMKVNNGNEVLVNQKHFYKEEDRGHVKYSRDHDEKALKINELFNVWATAFGEYVTIENYAKKKNIKIYNLTCDSFIDAFERKNISEILN